MIKANFHTAMTNQLGEAILVNTGKTRKEGDENVPEIANTLGLCIIRTLLKERSDDEASVTEKDNLIDKIIESQAGGRIIEITENEKKHIDTLMKWQATEIRIFYQRMLKECNE